MIKSDMIEVYIIRDILKSKFWKVVHQTKKKIE